MMDRFILRAQLRAVLPDGVVLHASSVAEDDSASIFLAHSGGGKSTIMRELARERYGAIADDSVVISRGTDRMIRCLPCGSMKQNMETEKIDGAVLKTIYFVEKGSPVCRCRISAEYAFYRAMRISSIMALGHISLEEQRQSISFLKKLFKMFPAYIIRYGLREDPKTFL
jgi:serine kinase of HPr protein (carbohydrate metabolism regulator)